MTWIRYVAYVPALFVVVMQFGFGVAEMFWPRWVFERVFPSYYDTRSSPVWAETEKLARNMGLYNWFLALGLLLSAIGLLYGTITRHDATTQYWVSTQF